MILTVDRYSRSLIRFFSATRCALAIAALFATQAVAVIAAQKQSNREPPATPPRLAQARRFLQHRSWPASHFRSYLSARPATSLQVQSTTPSTAAWQPLGPTAVLTPNYGLVTGRVSSITIDPSDTTGNRVLIGTTGGGVWASQNAASSGNVVFSPLTDSSTPFDSLRYGSISIGALTVQPGGTGVVLAGTGDPNDALDSYYGAGILRSTDSGSTWTAVSSTSDYRYSFMGEGFAGFAWSTVNTQLVVAAVAQSYEGTLVSAPYQGKSYAGLYYSTDAGATWSLCRITDGTGKDVQGPLSAFAGPHGNSATAVVWNPVRRLFIAAVRFHGYYQSTDGATWTRMAAQPAINLTSQMCPNNLGYVGSIACPIFRGALAVNPDSGDTFAWTVDLYNQDQGLWQDVCSLSGAACSNPAVAFTQQWSTVPLQTNTALGPATIANGDYNLALAAIPSAQDTILLAGANDLWRCTLAMGCSWRNTTNSYTCMGAKVAPYQHALAWNPANPQEIMLGTDSGLWRSMDGIAETGSVCSSDDSTHFQNLNGGLGSLADVETISSGDSPYTMMAGLGANGTAGVKSTEGPTSTWPQIAGGEGGPVAIDPRTPANWYVNSGPGVSVYRCSQASDCTPEAFGSEPVVGNADVSGDGYTMISPAPFIVDPLDSSQILLGTCRMWRGPADGTRWSATNAISPFLDGITGHSYCSGDPLIRSIAALPIAGGGEVIYAGMFGSLNGGSILGGHILKATFVPGSSSQPEWSDLTLNPVANNQVAFNHYALDISSIFIDPHDPSGNTVYVTVAGVPDLYHAICTVYRTTDGGAHWYEINSNIRTSPANSIVVDPQDSSSVYLATDAGVYSTRQVGECINGPSNCWSVFGTGLPYAPVTQLTVAPSSAAVLVAATYGRGIWQIPLWTADAELTTASLDASSLDFGSQEVGTASPAQTITVTNNGGVGLSITGITANSPFNETDNCGGTALIPGASCKIQVVFAPANRGGVTGELTIFANVSGGRISITLAGTGSPAGPIRISPGSLDFGLVEIGATSTSLYVSLENATGSSVPLTSVTTADPFSVSTNPCGNALPPNSACAVSVAFTPTVAGQVSGTFTVVSGAGTQSIYLKGTGAAAATDTLSASSLVFSNTAVGQESSPQILTLSNAGDLPLSAISALTSAGFRNSNTCGDTLGAHAACSISVVFAPTTVGSVEGTLTVTDASRSQTLTLSGTALAAPAIRVTATQIEFEAMPLRQISRPVTLTITNSGGAPMSNVGFQISGTAASSFFWNQSTCGTILQSGDACTVQLTFLPAQVGQLTATLVISSSTTGVSPVQIGLHGFGQGDSKLTISPSSFTFVQPAVGQSTAAQFATISNTGDLTASELTVTASTYFGITQSTCGSSLGPGANCSVGVIFTPAAAGLVRGTLSVSTPIFSNAAITALEGVGGAAGSIQVQPGSLVFPTTGVGSTSPSRLLTLTNTGPIPIADLTLSASAGFQVSSTTCGASLGVSSSCTAQITFQPASAGQQTGKVDVTSLSLAAPFQVTLSGMGFDFVLGVSGQANKTVSSGQTATYSLTLTSLNESAGNFTYSCSSLPANSICSFSPASLTLLPGVTTNLSLNISTGGSHTSANATSLSRDALYLLPAACLIFVPMTLGLRKRKLFVAVLMAGLIGIASCAGAGGGGGGNPVSNKGTPPGSYSVVVTAISNGVSHSIPITLVVD